MERPGRGLLPAFGRSRCSALVIAVRMRSFTVAAFCGEIEDWAHVGSDDEKVRRRPVGRLSERGRTGSKRRPRSMKAAASRVAAAGAEHGTEPVATASNARPVTGGAGRESGVRRGIHAISRGCRGE